MGTADFLFQTVPYLGEIISSSINPVSVPGSGDWVNPISWRAFYPLFCFNMQDNGVTFVFLTSALVVIKPKSMI